MYPSGQPYYDPSAPGQQPGGYPPALPVSPTTPLPGNPAPTSGYPAPTSGYPAPTSGYPAPTSGYPMSPVSGGLVPMGAPVIAQIGEIQVTSLSVRTPTGEIPLRGSSWAAQDQWLVTEKIATWAIVMAIVGFFCLTIFSLFFLLVKETVYSGYVQVTVTQGRFGYQARVPIMNFAQVQHLHNQVNYVRALAAQ